MSQNLLRRRVGADLLAARTSQCRSRRQLAVSAGISRTIVDRVERGLPGASLKSMQQIATALDCELTLVVGPAAQFGRAVRPAELSDLGHARGVGALRRIFAGAGFETAVEQPVGPGPRGWIDLLAFDPAHRRLIVIEFKTELRNLGGLDRQIEVYASGCMEAARAHGWRPVDVIVVVAVLATVENDATISANRNLLAARFPMRGRAAVAAMLDGGPISGRALLLADPKWRGRRIFTSARADGRRTTAPYRDYADFMARSAAARTGRVGSIPG